MSGGHFNGSGYIYYQVNQFADELENNIENNDRKDEYGYSYNFNSEVIEYLKKTLPEIRRVAHLMKEIDYLYSGDHGDDNFLRVVEKASVR